MILFILLLMAVYSSVAITLFNSTDIAPDSSFKDKFVAYIMSCFWWITLIIVGILHIIKGIKKVKK